MFAGRGRLIEEWKLWIRSNPPDDTNMPAVEGISVNGFEMSTGEIGYSEGMSITHESSIFAGSGARHAVMCWASNRDAKRAVTTARDFDPATGGDVKFAPATIADIDRALATRGTIMDITTKGGSVPFKLSDISAGDTAEIKEIQSQIAAGQLSAQAPCDAMYSDWSTEERSKLKTFLGGIFGWKN